MKTILCISMLMTLNFATLFYNKKMNLSESITRMRTLMGLNEELVAIENKLKKGDKGKEVEILQNILGIYSDGIFGPQTHRCLADFQEQKKIEDEEGVVGIETIKALQKLKDGTEQWSTPEYCKTKFFNKGIADAQKSEKKTKDTDSEEITPKSTSGDGIILMGGLDTRAGDKNINQQVEMVKNSSKNDNVIGHRYMMLSDVLNSIKENPSYSVILFSAGCAYSRKIADAMTDKSKLYIVEPYAVSSNTKSSVRGAVDLGVPNRNVVVGPSQGRGKGVVDGATETPSGIGHWGALEYVAGMLK